jgi:ABC-type glycerol-3-phosphate transport system substrate-binding protein
MRCYGADKVVALQIKFEEDFHPKVLEIARFNTGKLYSLPPNFGTGVIFYNKRMFREAGLSYPEDGWSWEEFREVCKKLTRRDKEGKITQFALAGWGHWNWIPMILQNGGQIVNKEGKCVLNSPEVLEALQFCKGLYTKEKVIASRLTFPSITQMGGYEIFSGEKAAMLPGDLSLSFQISPNIDWDIVAPPEKKGGKKYFHRGFWGYGITSDSKDKELAFELVKFLTSEKVQKETLQGVREGRYKKFLVIGMPTRVSLEKEFLSLLPGKHLSSYSYALFQLPDFFQAQHIGTYPMNEVLNRYSIQDNLEGITKDNLKDILDKITKEVNLHLQKDKREQ